MDVEQPALTFPMNFCCNCGDLNCVAHAQETRVSRFFGVRGPKATFRLEIPVCARCERSTRRHPPDFFSGLLVVLLMCAGGWLALWLLGMTVALPLWLTDRLWAYGALLGLAGVWLYYQLRRARPPQTSFYQPVRIRQASVQFADVMSGPGQVVFLKLAFTNPEYLNVFSQANEEALRSRRVAVTRA